MGLVCRGGEEMIHPHLVLKKSRIAEKGVFAKKNIPKGTILFIVNNTYAIIYTKEQVAKFSKRYKKILDNFAYGYNGFVIYDRGINKYWNHSCNPNCISYKDKMIALRDIKLGEEITYDYYFDERGESKQLLVVRNKCKCGSSKCRGILKPHSAKDAILLEGVRDDAARYISKVKQPLLRGLQ